MKKLIAFVEGQTELGYLESLLVHAGRDHRLGVQKHDAADTKSANSVISRIAFGSSPEELTHFAVILDVKGEGGVLSRLIENYSQLAKSYDYIITLRDVYPQSGKLATRKRRAMKSRQRAGAPGARMIFAVQEIETWFIAEDSHFERIDERLTSDMIKKNTGYDPSADHPQSITHPAQLLGYIYSLVGMGWKKKWYQIERTVAVLDHSYMESRNRQRLFGYRLLCSIMDEYFSVPTKWCSCLSSNQRR